MVKAIFPDHTYISLEDYDNRTLATADPRAFLWKHANLQGLILDEVQ